MRHIDKCTKACPGQTITGKLWDAERDRDEIFDPIKCRQKARQIAKEEM